MKEQNIKDGNQYIVHNGIKHKCYLAGYYNPIQHKWEFLIDGIDSDIHSGHEIEFLNSKLSVCFTQRRDSPKDSILSSLNNVSGKETYIQAWVI
jgi:hypothetical protein